MPNRSSHDIPDPHWRSIHCSPDRPSGCTLRAALHPIVCMMASCFPFSIDGRWPDAEGERTDRPLRASRALRKLVACALCSTNSGEGRGTSLCKRLPPQMPCSHPFENCTREEGGSPACCKSRSHLAQRRWRGARARRRDREALGALSHHDAVQLPIPGNVEQEAPIMKPVGHVAALAG